MSKKESYDIQADAQPSFADGHRWLDILFNRYYTSLWSFAFQFVGNDSVAEDLVQEAFIKLWENRDGFDNMNTARVYLFKNVKNGALDYIRHGKVKDKNEDELNLWLQMDSSNSFEYKILEEEVFGQLHDAVCKLPEQTRKIILLTLDGMSNPDIAGQLNISLNTLKTLKKRAYQQLRDILGPYRLALVNWFFLSRQDRVMSAAIP